MKYEKVFVVINEQHSLLEEQARILQANFAGAEIVRVPVPANGWSRHQMDEVIGDLYYQLLRATPKFPHLQNDPIASQYVEVSYGVKPTAVVFVSPIPYMIKVLSQKAIAGEWGDGGRTFAQYGVFIFHNDRREKRELPNGKVVYAVAREGWELV